MRGNRGGQVNCESGTGSEGTVDRQPSAVAVEDMFDQREAEAGAALSAALRDIDAVKPLGQPRQMLGRDAGDVIAHADQRLRLAIGRYTQSNLDIDAPAGGAVFERVFDQILENADELVMVAEHRKRIRRL